MNIKKYVINYDSKVEIHVEIDHDVLSYEALDEINNFWSDSDSRLAEEQSVLVAVLNRLAITVLYIQISNDYYTFGVVDDFDYSQRHGGVEGWPKMDGSEGIKITRVDEFEFESSDISILALGDQS